MIAEAALIALTCAAPMDSLNGEEVAGTITVQVEVATADSAARWAPVYGSPSRQAMTPVVSGNALLFWVEVPADWKGRMVWAHARDATGNVNPDRSNAVSVIAGPTVYALGAPGDTTSLPPFRVIPDSLLDDFAGDGALRSEWLASSAAVRQAGHLVLAEPIRWQARPFPAMQQAWVTLRSAAPAKAGLLLKIQPDGTRLEVAFEPGLLTVRTRTGSAWTARGTAAVSVDVGDVLAARMDAFGIVQAFKNGLQVASVDCSAWGAVSQGAGMVGLSATGAVWFDDFGASAWQHAAMNPLATQDTIVVSTLGRDRTGVEARWTAASANARLRWASFSFWGPTPSTMDSWPPGSPPVLHLEDATRLVLDDLRRAYGYADRRGLRDSTWVTP